MWRGVIALIRCPECGTEVSDKAQSCPRCSYPIVESAIALEEIEEKINKAVGISKLLCKGAIKELPNVLLEDEEVKVIINGWNKNYAGSIWSMGILAATNKRLVSVGKKPDYKADFPYNEISSVQYQKTGLLLGEITIFCRGNKTCIRGVDNDLIKDFCEYVNARITFTEKYAGIKKLPKIRREGLKREGYMNRSKPTVVVSTKSPGVTTLGLGLLVTWPIYIIWAALDTSAYNKKVLSQR